MMTKKQSKRTAGLKLLFILPVTALLVMCFSFSYAQKNTEEVVAVSKTIKTIETIAVTESVEVQEVIAEKDPIFMVVENMPKYDGGKMALYQFIGANVKYPAEARKKGIQGVVYTTFVVEKDGSLSDIKIVRGIGNGCDAEAIRVVKLLKYIPGQQRGQKVRVQFVLPINFKLQ